jgi:hypothetical protein
VPKDSLSLPRDMTFDPDGRLLQRFAPELSSLRVGTRGTIPRALLPLRNAAASADLHAVHDGEPVWLAPLAMGSGRQLELLARFEVVGNCSFGLHVLASRDMSERTTIGVDMADEVVYVDRRLSSGAEPFIPSTGLLDTRAGPLPPARNGSGGGGQARVVEIHAFVDGPVLTFIVDNETALSVYVYPQLPNSTRVALWANASGASSSAAGLPGGGSGTVFGTLEAWALRSPFGN